MGSHFRAISGALLVVTFLGLSTKSAFGAEPPANPWKNRPDQTQPPEPVFVSDFDDDSSSESFEDDYEFETGADLSLAYPAQYQSGGGMGGMGGRTAASQASMPGRGQRTPQSFTVRLARAPNMMGDFFGQPFTDASFETFVGRAVHHITSVNDIHRIDESGQLVTYLGGPGGNIPGSFFTPGPAPPAPDRIEGLTSNIPGDFIAVKTSDVVDVFNSVGDPSPDIADAAVFNVFQVMDIEVPAASPGDIVGRTRIQDNNSPLPKDRIFFDYNFFHNARLTSTGVDVNRFAPGFERTFWDQQASIEVRVPMALTLDNDVFTDGITDTSKGQFGNLSLVAKFLLSATETTAFAAGLGVAAPTAGDLEIGMVDGTQLARISNDSTHLLPYVAVLCTPENSSLYFQSFLTFDFDTTGNDVLANVNGTGLREVGTFRDQNFATMSVAAGSWFYENYAPGSMLRRIGWQAEAHYTETLNDADTVSSGGFRLGNPNADLSLVNGTFGLNFHVGQTIITTGYSVPLTSDDRVFDGELRAFVNRYF